jgi:competence protein ComEC
MAAGVALSDRTGRIDGPWLVAGLLVPAALLCLALIRRSAGAHDRWRAPRAYGAIALAGLACGLARHQAALRLPPDHLAHHLSDEPILTRFRGVVIAQPRRLPPQRLNPFSTRPLRPRTSVMLAVRSVHASESGRPASGLVRVQVDAGALALQPGDEVEVTGWARRLGGQRNPGEPNWKRWNEAHQIFVELRVPGAEHVRPLDVGRPNFHAALRARLRGMLLDAHADLPPSETDTLLEAIILGQRSAVTREINQVFTRTGTMHLLSVSGFHVGVLAGAVWWITRRMLGAGAKVASLLTLAAILGYAFIAEPEPPILRAAAMGCLACGAVLVGRPLSAMNWLSASAVLLLAVNPFDLFQVGFQLSFVQVAALCLFVQPVYRRLARVFPGSADVHSPAALLWVRAWRAVVLATTVSVCGWAFAAPLVMLHFGQFTPWGALQSVVVTPLAALAVLLGFGAIAVGGLVPPLHGAAAEGARLLMGWLLDSVRLLARMPGTSLAVSPPPADLVMVTYLLALLLVFAYRTRAARELPGSAQGVPEPAPARRGARLHRGVLCCVPIVWLGWAAMPAAHTRGVGFHVLAVGDGAAAILTLPAGEAAVFDSGTRANFDVGDITWNALRHLHVRHVRLLSAASADPRAFSGVPTLLSRVPCARLWVTECFADDRDRSHAVRQFFQLLPRDAPAPTHAARGDRLTIGPSEVEVLWPPRGAQTSTQAGDSALVLRIRAYGRRILVAGELGPRAMRALLDDHACDVRADVLVAPRGAALAPETAAFLSAVAPAVVVVSAADARPKLEALARERLGPDCRLLNTADTGAVRILLRPDGRIGVETPFAIRRR